MPQESQNLAPGRSSAWQLAHCACILEPQESQNLAPSRTCAWQLGQATVAGAGAAGAAAAAGASGAGPAGAVEGGAAEGAADLWDSCFKPLATARSFLR